ncbi:hypothetical protein [Streptosporangium sp. NPDC000396]
MSRATIIGKAADRLEAAPSALDLRPRSTSDRAAGRPARAV